MEILIIDFGSQYTHLLCRHIRELGTYTEIVCAENAHNEIIKINPKGIILSGGPHSVYDPDAPTITTKTIDYCVEHGIKMLGIC